MYEKEVYRDNNRTIIAFVSREEATYRQLVFLKLRLPMGESDLCQIERSHTKNRKLRMDIVYEWLGGIDEGAVGEIEKNITEMLKNPESDEHIRMEGSKASFDIMYNQLQKFIHVNAEKQKVDYEEGVLLERTIFLHLKENLGELNGDELNKFMQEHADLGWSRQGLLAELASKKLLVTDNEKRNQKTCYEDGRRVKLYCIKMSPEREEDVQ